MNLFGFGKALLFVALFAVPGTSFSQVADYGGQDGTILRREPSPSGTWIVRKYTQDLTIGGFSTEENWTLYDERSFQSVVVDTLKLGDKIYISRMAEIELQDSYEVWLLAKKEHGNPGWMFLLECSKDRSPEFDVPYFDDRWSITRYIESSNRRWTIRKMLGQAVSVWERLNIRDNPGVDGTNVIGLIVPRTDGYPAIHLEVFEVTEEEEIIDGLDDIWLKIEYEGVTGWIFGGYASVERGGAKYYTPKAMVLFSLSGYEVP